jgi:hypothetical protein
MRPTVLLLLATAACDPDVASDPRAGTWSASRTFVSLTEAPPEEGEPDEPCPEVTRFGGFSFTVDPEADPPVTGVDGEGWLEGDDTVTFTMLDEIAGYQTLAGATLRHDAETDRLIGTGGVGCGEGCTYRLDVIAERVDD